MKTVTLKTGEFLFIEMPESIYAVENGIGYPSFYIENDNFFGNVLRIVYGKKGTLLYEIDLPKDFHYDFISTSKDITEEQAAEIVENDGHFNDDKFPNYKEYGEVTWATFPYESALESLNTLLKSIELDVEKKEYLILKKISNS